MPTKNGRVVLFADIIIVWGKHRPHPTVGAGFGILKTHPLRFTALSTRCQHILLHSQVHGSKEIEEEIEKEIEIEIEKEVEKQTGHETEQATEHKAEQDTKEENKQGDQQENERENVENIEVETLIEHD